MNEQNQRTLKNLEKCELFYGGQRIDLLGQNLCFELELPKLSHNEKDTSIITIIAPPQYFEILEKEDVYIKVLDPSIKPEILKVISATSNRELVLYLDDRCVPELTLRYSHKNVNHSYDFDQGNGL